MASVLANRLVDVVFVDNGGIMSDEIKDLSLDPTLHKLALLV